MFTKKKKQSKAISPLIATILLVAIALALAGILYSWASQNAKEVTNGVTNTTNTVIDCSSIDLYIDYGCVYDATNGVSFILNDNSTVNIDDNLTLTVIDANNSIQTASFAPNFKGGSMAINDTVYSNTSDFQNLVTPLKKVQILVKSCPKKATFITSCGN